MGPCEHNECSGFIKAADFMSSAVIVSLIKRTVIVLKVKAG